MPCLHNFCGSCYSDWLLKSKECPQCRLKVEKVKKNTCINNIITRYLECHTEKMRPQE